MAKLAMPIPEMSDTPRTDALADRFGDIDPDSPYWEALALATDFELELNAKPQYVSLRPAAWLHKEHGNAYVITDRIKQLWIDAGNPGHVENYTIPLYTGSDISRSEG